MVATVAVISTGRKRSDAPIKIASRSEAPVSRTRLRFATMMMPFCTATPNNPNNPAARGIVEGLARNEERSQPTKSGERDDPQDQEGLTQLPDLGVGQKRHEAEHETENQGDPGRSALLFLDLPRKFEPI